MIDFAEKISSDIKESLPAFKKYGFRYLSTDGYLFLQTMSANLNAAKQKGYSSAHSDNSRQFIDAQWVVILNNKENWRQFRKNKTPKEIQDINMLDKFWKSQNEFSLTSNKSLLTLLDDALVGLKHVKKAMKEVEKNRNRLNVEFLINYENFLNNLYEELVNVKRQLTNAMFLRLKIAYHYNNRAAHKIPDVDDVVYYISHSLNNLKSLNANEQKILPSEPRRTLFTHRQNYYIKFYNCVKIYGESIDEKNQIDLFHWKTIINKRIFPQTNIILDKNKMSYLGFLFAEVGKKQKTNIAIPIFLHKFVPEKYQTPEWFYWQDNKILDFWTKRQDFLVGLQFFWVDQQNLVNEESHKKIQQCIKLIECELAEIIAENPSFFAFTYKDMQKKWSDCLKNIRTDLLQTIKKYDDQTHPTVTHTNAIPENKANMKSRNNKPLKSIEKNEAEYQKWLSEDFSKKPRLHLSKDWKHSKKSSCTSVSQIDRYNFNGSKRDYVSSVLSAQTSKPPSVIESGLRVHR